MWLKAVCVCACVRVCVCHVSHEYLVRYILYTHTGCIICSLFMLCRLAQQLKSIVDQCESRESVGFHLYVADGETCCTSDRSLLPHSCRHLIKFFSRSSWNYSWRRPSWPSREWLPLKRRRHMRQRSSWSACQALSQALNLLHCVNGSSLTPALVCSTPSLSYLYCFSTNVEGLPCWLKQIGCSVLRNQLKQCGNPNDVSTRMLCCCSSP